MAKMKYKARWERGCTSVADVDFEARSDYEAKQVANKLARELGVTNTPRTITRRGPSYDLIECIQTGVSE